MFIPPTPHNPDEHLMHERARQAEQDSENSRGLGSSDRRKLTTGDVFVFSGVIVVGTLAVLFFFFAYW